MYMFAANLFQLCNASFKFNKSSKREYLCLREKYIRSNSVTKSSSSMVVIYPRRRNYKNKKPGYIRTRISPS